jgi:hypothetical protein
VDVDLSPATPSQPWPRCADWARQVAVDPVGTAVHARGWLLLDWPQPWPRDAADVAELAPVRSALAGSGIRLQLVVPRPDEDRWTVVLHDLAPDADGWFSGYRRRRRSVEPAAVASAAIELIGDRDGAGDAAGGDEPGADHVDVLVCGHGSRDRCCGSMGTGLAMTAAATGIAVRRTSHTGGHRFAPTGLVLPQGTAWAFLDEDALARIVSRSGSVDDLLERYRGSVGLATPAQQAAERAAFAAVGWPWLSHRRRAVEIDAGRVQVESVAPDGLRRSWLVGVAAGRRLPVPECGHDPAAAAKSQSEVVVTSVEETSVP